MVWNELSMYAHDMTGQEIKTLPIAQKPQLMEALWEDLRDRFDQLDLSQEQRDLLDSRRKRVLDGTAQLLDWDSVKASIGRS